MCQDINTRLNKLRSAMADSKIDAIVVPLSDPHNSEYMADHWKKLEWISGFTGSAGTIMISKDHAGLWTDGRYFVQGEMELAGTKFELHKAGLIDKSTPLKWLSKHMKGGATVAMTGDMWTHQSVTSYQKELADKGVNVITDVDLIGELWTKDRPDIPTDKLFIHDVAYAGYSAAEKLDQVRQKMKAKAIDWHLITTLDDIGWLTNLRGYDVEFNPVFIAYVIVGLDSATLFINPEKLTPEVEEHLSKEGINHKPYEAVGDTLASINGKILINPEDCNQDLYSQANPDDIIHGKTITRWLKAIKNPTELAHIDNAMVKDGVALAHTFHWLDQTLGKEKITEADVVDKLAHFRSQQDGYYGESFAAIIGYRGNGAIIHYRPDHKTAHEIKREGLLLCDSGGQYVDGTTDITRTFALSTPTDEELQCYTAVLKGHISLDRMHFPVGTNGAQLDVLARQHLWQIGKNYNHGTGHGVGFFMNVHEPPQGFAPGTASRATTELVPGMFSSNEPGIYRKGAYGIRIENLIVTEKSEYDGFLKHRNVTLYPLDRNLIDKSKLTPDEISWVNDYHQLVWDKVGPHLSGEVKEWFEGQCQPI